MEEKCAPPGEKIDYRKNRTVGSTYGNLTVISVIDSKKGRWEVRCTCGHVFEAARQHVFRQSTHCRMCKPKLTARRDFPSDSVFLRYSAETSALARMAKKGSDSALFALVRRVWNGGERR